MIAAGHLVRVLEEWSPANPGFYLYYPGRRPLPAALCAFVDLAKMAASAARL
jgi:DNA-binding transcriptional LysR family regulator